MMDHRRPDEQDPFLDWKVRVFFAGAALLMAGVVLNRAVLALAAVAVLAVGVVLIGITRLRRRRREEERIREHDES